MILSIFKELSKSLRMHNCKFCNKFHNPHLSINKEYDTIIFETENFIVTPTMGSLVEGWLLIISKNHFICAGQTSYSLKKELKGLIEQIKTGLKDLKKNIFIFEHGPHSSLQSTGCGIDHLHLHVVPLDFNLFKKAQEFYPYKWNLSDLFSTTEYFEKCSSYLYMQCPSGEEYVTSDLNIPSQFFRRVIAKELNIEEHYDWKKNFGKENIDKTLKILSQ